MIFPPHVLFRLQHGVSPEKDSLSQTSPVWDLPTWCSSSGMLQHRLFPSKNILHTLLQHGFRLHRATGPTRGWNRISAPAPGAPSPLILHWPWCFQTCSSYTFSLLSNYYCCEPYFSLHFLEYVITEFLPTALFGSALASSWSTLESTGTGSLQHSLCNLLMEVTLAALSPPLSKTCHRKPTHTEMQTRYLWILLKEVICLLPSWE